MATRQVKIVSMTIIETHYQRIIVADVSERSYGIGLLCTSQNSVVEKKWSLIKDMAGRSKWIINK